MEYFVLIEEVPILCFTNFIKMEYVKFNHYNPSGYIDFVPDATKKANIKTVIIIIAGITAIGVIVWYKAYKTDQKNNKQRK